MVAWVLNRRRVVTTGGIVPGEIPAMVRLSGSLEGIPAMKFLTWLTTLDTRQWIAASRQYISFFAGVLAAVGFVSATQSQDLVKELGDLVAGFTQLVAAVVAIAGAVVALVNSFKAAHAASPTGAVERVQEIATTPSAGPQQIEAKAALITATANLAEVKGVALEPAARAAPALNAATPDNVKLAA